MLSSYFSELREPNENIPFSPATINQLKSLNWFQGQVISEVQKMVNFVVFISH